MKIVLVAGNDLLHARRARRHARTLAAAGHEVTLHGVRSNGTEQEEDDGNAVLVRSAVPTWVWRDRGPAAAWRVVHWYQRFASVVQAAVERQRPDALHACGVDTVEPVLAAARELGIPCVLDDPGETRADLLGRRVAGMQESARKRAYDSVVGLLRRRADALRRRVRVGGVRAITTSSRALALDHAQRFGGPQPIVVRDCPPRWNVKRSETLRVRLGAFPGERLIAYRGPGGPGSGIDAVVHALRILGDGHVLAVLGCERPIEEIERVAVAAGVSDRVRFLPPVPEDELLMLLASADVAVIPREPIDHTTQLSIPPELLECLAAGVPVAASGMPAMGRIIQESGAGVLYAARCPSDPGAIAEALSTLLKDDFLLEACREQARAAVASELSWERESQGLIGLYERLGSRD